LRMKIVGASRSFGVKGPVANSCTSSIDAGMGVGGHLCWQVFSGAKGPQNPNFQDGSGLGLVNQLPDDVTEHLYESL
jgi:hypothetical protein